MDNLEPYIKKFFFWSDIRFPANKGKSATVSNILCSRLLSALEVVRRLRPRLQLIAASTISPSLHSTTLVSSSVNKRHFFRVRYHEIHFFSTSDLFAINATLLHCKGILFYRYTNIDRDESIFSIEYVWGNFMIEFT